MYVNICIGVSLALASDITFATIQPTYLTALSFDKMDVAHIISIGSTADLGSRVIVTLVSSCTTFIKARQLFLLGLIGSIGSQSGKLSR